MPVKLVQTSQKFFNEYNNDIGFGANLTDFTFNLAGHIMENVKYVQQVDVSWIAVANEANRWQITHEGSGIFIFEQIPTFKSDGFSVGDTIAWVYTPPDGETTTTGTVTSLSEGIMIAQMDSIPSQFTTPGTSLGSGGSVIHGTTELTACKYRFGLLGNSENVNYESKVSLNDQGYYSGTVGLGDPRDTSFQSMIKVGQYEDWKTGLMNVRYISNPSTYVQRFEIEHVFTIVPYYLDGEIDNLNNNIIPELLDGDNSIKYVYNPGFRNVLSNPNTEKSIIVSENLGSVAWFNENFNGFNNNYEVTSIVYEENVSGDPSDGLLVSLTTKTTITVSKITGSFAADARYGAYISYLPSQEEYQGTLSDLKTNFLYDRAINNVGSSAVTGDDFITSMDASILSGDLVIEVETLYSSSQQQFLSGKISDNAANFIIGVQVGDEDLPSGSSDRVLLLADVATYSGGADIEGLLTLSQYDIFTHGRVEGVDSPTTDAEVWIEEGLYLNFDLELNLNQNAIINTLDFNLVAYNPVQKRYFELDTFSFNPGASLISGGVQQINETGTRGYILKDGDPFNDANISVGTNTAGIQHYTGRIAQKITWQDWRRNLNVDTVFYDDTKPEFNLNKKASNYSQENGYEIRLMFHANVSGTSLLGVSGDTDYWIFTPEILVNDYDQDGISPLVWTHSIETFDETGTNNLSGSVQQGLNTLIRATWTNSGGAVSDITGLIGLIRIQEVDQPGDAITEMSNVQLPATNQLLIPSSGDKLDVYIDSGNVVMECIVDGSKANPIPYCISSEIKNNLAVIDGKVTEQGELKITEGGEVKIIE